MKKMILGIGLVGILLVGLASAGLVYFLSNEVSAAVEVLGPVFYTAAGEALIMNDEPDSSTIKTINGIEEIDFLMDENLEGIDFYNPELNFVVDLEINNLTVPRGIELEFGYIKNNGNSVEICNIQKIDIAENGAVEIPCDGDGTLSDVKSFYYTIEGMGDAFLEYRITTKESYVEITGVVE